MATYDNPSLVLERDAERQSHWAPRLLGQWLLSALRGSDARAANGSLRRLTRGTGEEQDTMDIQLALRFPLARQGYDPVAVDEYVEDLERELAALDSELVELRGQSAPADEVAAQIQRMGEQTSAVLLAAHQQREEILRAAKDEAERCVAEATATATRVTEETELRLQDLRAHTDAARNERDCLLSDIRTISAALSAIADSAAEPSSG